MSTPNPATGAIEHVLTRIRTSPEVGYYMGVGTESFVLLCEAYAGIHGKIFDDVEEMFRPLKPRDPTEALRKCISDLEDQLAGNPFRITSSLAEYGPQNLTAHEIMERVRELLGQYSTDPARCVREIAALYDLQQLPINLVTAAP